ncbi:MAG TPA: MlaD family protein [Longimicrobiales bacterium]|nr:MlaD family protein [Longimicrobiales bacterium]
MSRGRDVAVGASIVLAVLVVVVGTVWLKGTGFGREERTLVAQFREVGQIMEGNQVKYRGVPIGRVEQVALTPSGDYVLVSMRVDSRVSLPEDPVSILSPESLFGDWQAEIHSRTRYPRYAFTEPSSSSVIPGYSLPDMSQLTAVADRIAENLAVLSDRVEVAFTEETALKIRQAIENIQQVSEELVGLLARQEATLDAVAQDLAATTETLGEAAEAVNRIAAQVESAIAGGEVTQIVQNVERATAQLDSLTASLVVIAGDFGGTMASADTAFAALTRLAESVEEGEGTLGRLLTDTLLYNRLTGTNDLIQAILEDFRANPRKYIKLEIF